MTRRTVYVCLGLILALTGIILAQRSTPYLVQGPTWELKSVFPQEISPGRHRQVPHGEIERLSWEGWDLVSVTPYVYQNDERGPDGQKQVVTQVYPAYFFKRPRPAK